MAHFYPIRYFHSYKSHLKLIKKLLIFIFLFKSNLWSFNFMFYNSFTWAFHRPAFLSFNIFLSNFITLSRILSYLLLSVFWVYLRSEYLSLSLDSFSNLFSIVFFFPFVKSFLNDLIGLILKLLLVLYSFNEFLK